MAVFPGKSLIPSPPITGPLAGVLQTISIIDISDPHLLFSGVQYESDGCNADLTEVDFDDQADCIRTAEKEFEDGLEYVESFEFSLYRGYVCRTVGMGTEDEWIARAERRFDQAESFALAKQLKAHFDTNGSTITNEVDLTSIEATALLFEALGNVHAPLIHSAPSVGLFLNKDDVVKKSGGTLVLDSGYSGGSRGNARIYGTGPVTIWRGPRESHVVLDAATNHRYAITERQYAVTVECDIFYVDADLFPEAS